MFADLIQAIGECLRTDLHNPLHFLIYVLRKLSVYQMDVSRGEILYCRQLRHIFDNHLYEKAVLPGRLCTAQAVVKQVGIVGVAMTCVIAFNYYLNERADALVMTPVLWYLIELKIIAHLQLTSFALRLLLFKHFPFWFCDGEDLRIYPCMLLSVFGPLRHSTLVFQTRYIVMKCIMVLWITVCFLYGFLLLKSVYLILLGCWILPQFRVEQIVTQYLWIWLAAFLMIILYGIMFAVIRRWFNITHGIPWRNQPRRDALDTDSDDNKKIKAVANSMLLLVLLLFYN